MDNMDLFALLRSLDKSKEELMWLLDYAVAHPKEKLVVPIPGTEPKLNGVTGEDLAEAVKTFKDGAEPARRDLMLKIAGNPKSDADNRKLTHLLNVGVPGLEVEKARRAKYTVRLTDQTGGTEAEADATEADENVEADDD